MAIDKKAEVEKLAKEKAEAEAESGTGTAVVKADEIKKTAMGVVTLLDDVKKKKKEDPKEAKLTKIDEALIHQGLLNFYNDNVRAKDAEKISVINFNAWNDIVDMFGDSLGAEVRVGWRNKSGGKRNSTTFFNQLESWKKSFWDMKVKDIHATDIGTQRKILMGMIIDEIFLQTGLSIDWYMSKTSVSYLAYLKKFSHRDLGTNHKMSIADMNIVQTSYFLKE